jgi:hypothetical protein
VCWLLDAVIVKSQIAGAVERAAKPAPSSTAVAPPSKAATKTKPRSSTKRTAHAGAGR